MSEQIGREAAIPNPALDPFRALIGTWDTVGTHPLVSGTIHGRTSFEWLEGGAFLIWRSEINDDPRFPSGIAVIGRDDDQADCSIIYFDERGVNRIYTTSLSGNVWRWWRSTPEFSQRVTATISANGQTIVSVGELSRDGSTWEGDLSLNYTRVK